MTSVNALVGDGAFQNALVQMQLPTTLIVISMCGLLYFKNNNYWIIYAPAALWKFMFYTGSHSRVSAFLALIVVIFAFVHKKNYNAGIFALLALFSIFNAFEGRSAPFHGISQIEKYPEYVYLGITKDFGQVIANSGEGIFSASELFAFQPNFGFPYIWRSFSPILSSVDGFDKINEQYQIRLHLFAPMSAIQEVFSFGYIYAALYFSTQFLASYLTSRAAYTKPSIISLSLNTMVFVGFLLEWAYPTRHSYRFFVYAIIISTVIVYSQKKSKFVYHNI
jgi:hypothetical protein